MEQITVMEQITAMFVMLGLWTVVVSAGLGVAVMLRLDAIERRMDSERDPDVRKASAGRGRG